MTPSGNVAIIINAHFPYVRRAGRWPHGEESLHRVIAECYVPLLGMLHDLHVSELAFTVSISPVLLEQLADPLIIRHFESWIDDWRVRAMADLRRFEAESNGHGVYLARFYLDWIDGIKRTFVDRFGRNIVAAIRSMGRDTIELLLAPATYAYLPPLHSAQVRAQIYTGALSVLQHLRQRPAGLWLPGGGSSSALTSIARELGLRYAVGEPQPQPVITRPPATLPIVHSDHTLAEHVIASGVGYPGDGLYREFYRDDPESGMHYWRVTGIDVPLERKDWYDPYHAFNRVEEHADHFVRAIRERLQVSQASEHPTVVISFDADLFGHWWFEGVRWLQAVLTRLIAADDLRLVRLSDVVGSLPVVPTESTFAPHPLFNNPRVTDLHDRLRQAGALLRTTIQQYPAAEGLQGQILSQAARELLLAQGSDWLALIAMDAATEYAQDRFNEHLARLMRLLELLHDGHDGEAERYVQTIAELDNVFPALNYHLFS